MHNKIVVLLLFLGFVTKSLCQNPICYNVYNNTDSDIVSWINFDSNYERESNSLIREHFHTRIHDFCLSDLFWHVEDYKFDGFTPQLLVLIPAKSQFTYYVNNNCYKKGCYINTFNRHNVEETLGYQLEERWMYKEKDIYVIDCNRCRSYDKHKKIKECFTIVIN